MQLQNADGFSLFVYQWQPPSIAVARGVVQVLHGASEHAQRYAEMAQALNAAGYFVYAHDQRGHGQTAGDLTQAGIAGVDGWLGLLKDARQVTALIRQQHPGLPLFLFGHSMGALLAQRYIQQWGDALQGVILSGPGGPIGDLDQVIAWAEQAAQADATAPSALASQMFAALNTPFAPGKTGFEWLSRDEAEVQNYVDDPWCGFPFCNRLAADLFAGMRSTWQPAAMATIPKQLPLFAIAGGNDPVGEHTTGVQALLDHYTKLGMRDLSYKFYPEARHELLHELNRAEVHRDLVEWLNGHL